VAGCDDLNVTAQAALTDPSAAWWLKLEHAQRHMRSLNQVYDDYEAARPVEVMPERTGVPGEMLYRLRIHKHPPPEISLRVGDVVHSLRSALDGLAFHLAALDLGRRLAPDEERRTAFPITRSPDEFAEFFKQRKRGEIMRARVQDAIRDAQPFRHLEIAKSLGVGLDNDYVEDCSWHNLVLLAEISNIDKHRRLTLTAWYPGLVYWGSDREETSRRWRPGDRSFVDGSVVGYITGDPKERGEVVHEFNLALADLPELRDAGLRRTLDGWQAAVRYALGQMINNWTQSSMRSGPGARPNALHRR
jgi:hypothetical protein